MVGWDFDFEIEMLPGQSDAEGLAVHLPSRLAGGGGGLSASASGGGAAAGAGPGGIGVPSSGPKM